jgi:hypothetical protein
MTVMLLLVKHSLVKNGALLWCNSQLFHCQIWGEVLAHFHALTVKCHSSLQNPLFGLPGWILCDQFLNFKEKDENAPVFALHMCRHFQSWRVWLFYSNTSGWLMLSSLNMSSHCQGLCQTLHKIWCTLAVGSIVKLDQARHDSKCKGIENQCVHPAVWNFVHSVPRYASTIIYRSIVALQLLHRGQHQSRKLWIAVHLIHNKIKQQTCKICAHT